RQGRRRHGRSATQEGQRGERGCRDLRGAYRSGLTTARAHEREMDGTNEAADAKRLTGRDGGGRARGLIAGCARGRQHAGLDASEIVNEFTEAFLRNKAFTNLPRKFNVGITGCTEHCTHAESQDLALTPAARVIGGEEILGFNVAVGGKMGSGGYRVASALDV